MVRVDRKQRDFLRREEEILAAALDLLSGPDWESISVEQIAMHAEVGKGTVYNHFSSKDELLFRLLIRFYSGLLQELQEQKPQGGAAEQFRAIIRRSLEYHLEHMEYRYVVPYCERTDFKERAAPEWRDDFMALDRSFENWSRPFIEQAMESGEFEKRDPDSAMLGMHATFKGAISILWAGDGWCPDYCEPTRVIESVTDFMVTGMVGRN